MSGNRHIFAHGSVLSVACAVPSRRVLNPEIPGAEEAAAIASSAPEASR